MAVVQSGVRETLRCPQHRISGGPTGPGSPTMFTCTTCACHLVIFISEESLFVDAIKSSAVQTAIFHLNTV